MLDENFNKVREFGSISENCAHFFNSKIFRCTILVIQGIYSSGIHVVEYVNHTYFEC